MNNELYKLRIEGMMLTMSVIMDKSLDIQEKAEAMEVVKKMANTKLDDIDIDSITDSCYNMIIEKYGIDSYSIKGAKATGNENIYNLYKFIHDYML